MNLQIKEFNNQTMIKSNCLIIMPIYNRRHFLQQAFNSLAGQTYSDWHLIIVDDGSTDQPLETVEAISHKLDQRVTYVKQPNGGPGAARATGQSFVRDQKYVAFFDSDDYWLPDYLKIAIHELDSAPKLDWVFCPCRRVDYSSGRTLLESTLIDEETKEPLSFLSLPVTEEGESYVFQDNHCLALTQLKQPIHAGFQNSVISAALSKDVPIPEYRIGEDRYFLMSAILKGYKIGYIKKVGVIYNVHKENLSDTNHAKVNYNKLIKVQKELCRSLSDIRILTNNKEILAEANRQCADIKFWLVAYRYHWESGQIVKALLTMAGVIFTHPTNFRYLKTFMLSTLRAPLAFLRNSNKGEL